MTKNVFACLLAMATVGFASAQDEVSAGGRPLRMTQIPPQKMGLNAVDAKALKEIAIGNLFQIKTSEIALNHGSSEWVKQYAKEMIHEHTQSQNELKQLAMNKGVSLPQSLPADKMAICRKLSNSHGSAFDSMYRKIMLKAHRDSELKIRKAMVAGRDADVRNLEVKTLPGVVMHFRLAQMQQTMMGSTQHEGGKA